jgi:hypothetical protein
VDIDIDEDEDDGDEPELEATLMAAGSRDGGPPLPVGVVLSESEGASERVVDVGTALRAAKSLKSSTIIGCNESNGVIPEPNVGRVDGRGS